MLELEGGRKARDDRIKALENQKKALIEKSDLMQVLQDSRMVCICVSCQSCALAVHSGLCQLTCTFAFWYELVLA